MTTYRTKEGDVIDVLCKAHYGREDMVHAVYAANSGLAAYGPALPKGVLINFPEQSQEQVKALLRLWGRHAG